MNVEGWNDSKYWNFIRSLLRKGWGRYPNKYRALARAKKERGVYICASCTDQFKANQVAVDHIKPCGRLTSYEDIAPFVTNLFCSVDNLQVLCHECHKYKTLTERGMSPEDIIVSEFKKQNASKQKDILIHECDTLPESNEKKRIEQYRHWLRTEKLSEPIDKAKERSKQQADTLAYLKNK